jgi:hypothetical protein
MNAPRPSAWAPSTPTRHGGVVERLKAWVEKQNARAIEPVPYDPSHLGDDIAMRTDWGPAVQGGANFRTHRLLHVGPRRAEFHTTIGARAFFGVFTLIGLGVAAGFVTGATASLRSGSWLVAIFMLIPITIGGAFAALGTWLWWHYGAPVVFDKQRGEYWKGRTSPAEVGNRHTFKERVQLDRIHALQLVSEHVKSDDSSYHSYELNLVLKDGARMNVVDHGKLESLRKDAQELARFLGKPLWDATASVPVD